MIIREPTSANIAAAVSKATSQRRQATAGRPERTKGDIVLQKLQLARGVTVAQIVEATGWQSHSARAFLSAVVRKKLGLNLVSEVGKDGQRRYRVISGGDGAGRNGHGGSNASADSEDGGDGSNDGGDDGKPEPDPSLIDLVARAHVYLTKLTGPSAMNTSAIASAFGVDRADVGRILPLAFLSPAMLNAILTGRQSASVTARQLARTDLPILWVAQDAALQ